MNKLICFLFGMMLISSCTYDVMKPKQPTPPVGTQQIWSCTDAQHLDSAKLSKLLLGSWRWTYGASFYMVGGGDNGWFPANKNVSVTFDSLGNYTLHEDTLTTTGTWNVYPSDQFYFGIVLSNGGSYFYGIILICGDQLMFDDGILDGPNHLFARIP